MGLDGQTSLEVIPFPERSAPTQAFTQGRNMGVMFHGGQGIHWGLGVFANSSEAFDTPGSERAISARLYGAPQDGSKGLLHLGLAASFRDGHSTGLQFSARPGTHGSPQMIDTGLLPDARAATLALELAHASGQWTTVAEVMASSVQLPQKNGLTIGGAQVSAVYSFSDERSRWEPERGLWDAHNPQWTRSGSNGRPVSLSRIWITARLKGEPNSTGDLGSTCTSRHAHGSCCTINAQSALVQGAAWISC
jgi:phosphate-selective porin